MADYQELMSGNPDAVAELVGRLEATKESMRSQVGRLRGFDQDQFWIGDAAENFRENLGDLPEQIDGLVTRYSTVAGALSAYHPELAAAQVMARQAMADRDQAEDDRAAAEGDLAAAEGDNRAAEEAAASYNEANPDQPARQPALIATAGYSARRDDAQRRIDDANRRLEEAVAAYDEAAQRCAGSIEGAIDDALENTSGFFAWADRQITAVVDALPIEALAEIVTVIGAVIGVLSIFFPVLAPLALALGVLALILDSMLVVAGEGSWVNVALDVVGIATFGIGRTLTATGRAGNAASRAGQAVASARATVTQTADGIRYARYGQQALANLDDLTGVSAVSSAGNTVYGSVARNVLNAQYADKIARGTHALTVAEDTLQAQRAAESAARSAAHLPGASGLPGAGTWGWGFSGAPAASAGSAGANLADLAGGLGGRFGPMAQAGAAVDLAGLGTAGVQVADVAVPDLVP